jgi:hypothetical protein
VTGEYRKAKRMFELGDKVLASDQAAVLFFEPGSGVGLQKSSLRITPALRRLLALAQPAEGTLDDIQAAFDEETGGLMQKRPDGLRATGADFIEELCTREGNRTITASGQRVSTKSVSTQPGSTKPGSTKTGGTTVSCRILDQASIGLEPAETAANPS